MTMLLARTWSHVPKHHAAAGGLEDVIVALDRHCGGEDVALVGVLMRSLMTASATAVTRVASDPKDMGRFRSSSSNLYPAGWSLGGWHHLIVTRSGAVRLRIQLPRRGPCASLISRTGATCKLS